MQERIERLVELLRSRDILTVREIVEETGLPRYEVLGILHFLEWLEVVRRKGRSVIVVDPCKLKLLLDVYATDCTPL